MHLFVYYVKYFLVYANIYTRTSVCVVLNVQMTLKCIFFKHSKALDNNYETSF